MPSAGRVLCDAGPLIALFDPTDSFHDACRATLDAFEGSFITTWPVLTEAFYFVDHPEGRRLLWDFVLSDVLRIEELSGHDPIRMRDLMERYADAPMDFTDASLVALAERIKIFRVFTLDVRGFAAFRPRNAEAFEIIS